MKKLKLKSIFIIPSIVGLATVLLSWGFFGHEHIDRAAIFALPTPLQTFFYNHIDFITQEASVPDLRKHTLNDKAEGPRHFIDLENYGSLDTLPKTLEEAKKKYDEKFLSQNGILPWYLMEMMDKLTTAFKEKKKTEILFLASDLGHYLGDAHMPFHTSANYDGQQTGQKGIHSLWEARLPEMFGKDYNYYTGDAKFIDNVPKAIWALMASTHSLVDTALGVDMNLRKKFSENKIFKTDKDGKVIKGKYGASLFSDEYAKEFHTALKGMVERQLRKSIATTADFWYTAWINAGKPDVGDLDPSELTQRNSKLLEEDLKLWKQGKVFGIESEKEF
jgi:hypothetical protein